jgi:hypothetical protein
MDREHLEAWGVDPDAVADEPPTADMEQLMAMDAAMANGATPAEAEAEVTGVDVEKIKRRMVMEILHRDYGVRTNRFRDAVTEGFNKRLAEDMERAEAAIGNNFYNNETKNRLRIGDNPDFTALWVGNERSADAQATEELKGWWTENGRITREAFEAELFDTIDGIGTKRGGRRDGRDWLA